MAPFVGVDDLRPPATAARALQNLQAERLVKAILRILAEHIPGVEIHARHQIEKALLHREVGGIGFPDQIHRRNLPEIHQLWKLYRRIAWNLGEGFW